MKTVSPEVSEAALELFAIAMSTPRHVADVSMEYAAHVNGITCRIYLGGWIESKVPVYDSTIYLDEDDASNQVAWMLSEVRKIIEQ